MLINCVFYFPVFYENNYTFDFIQIPLISSDTPGWYGGPKISIETLLPRFVYKIYLISGVFSGFIIFFVLLKNYRVIFYNFKNHNFFILCVIIFNLLTFYFMPTKTLIINPFMVFLYIFVVKSFKQRILYTLIFLNLFQWFVSYKFLDIEYKKQDICWQKEAISATFNFRITKGDIFNLNLDNSDLAKCYSKSMGDYKYYFEIGKPLILSKPN